MYASSISVLRCQKRYAELGTAPQPRAGTIARLLVERMHVLQHVENSLGSDRVAHAERTFRVTEAEHHGAVEIVRRRNAHLDDIATDVDDVRHDALRDEAGRVVDDRDGHA